MGIYIWLRIAVLCAKGEFTPPPEPPPPIQSWYFRHVNGIAAGAEG